MTKPRLPNELLQIIAEQFMYSDPSQLCVAAYRLLFIGPVFYDLVIPLMYADAGPILSTARIAAFVRTLHDNPERAAAVREVTLRMTPDHDYNSKEVTPPLLPNCRKLTQYLSDEAREKGLTSPFYEAYNWFLACTSIITWTVENPIFMSMRSHTSENAGRLVYPNHNGPVQIHLTHFPNPDAAGQGGLYVSWSNYDLPDRIVATAGIRRIEEQLSVDIIAVQHDEGLPLGRDIMRHYPHVRNLFMHSGREEVFLDFSDLAQLTVQVVYLYDRPNLLLACLDLFIDAIFLHQFPPNVKKFRLGVAVTRDQDLSNTTSESLSFKEMCSQFGVEVDLDVKSLFSTHASEATLTDDESVIATRGG